METPTGTLLSVAARGGLARVRVDQPAACARCAAGRGCGAGLFARERAGEVIEARVVADGLEEGMAVDILLDDGGLWRAALFAYGYPLLGALGGGWSFERSEFNRATQARRQRRKAARHHLHQQRP